MHATPLHAEQKPCGGRSLQGRALSEHMFLLNCIILGRWTVVAIFMGVCELHCSTLPPSPDWHHVPSNTRKGQKCVSVKLINSIVEGVVSWHWWTLWFLVISWAFSLLSSAADIIPRLAVSQTTAPSACSCLSMAETSQWSMLMAVFLCLVSLQVYYVCWSLRFDLCTINIRKSTA